MRRLSRLIIIVTALAVLAAACSTQATTTPLSGSYQTLTIDEFASIVTNDSDEYTIVNVHIPYEGEVAETDFSIPYNDIESLTITLPDKNASIILYCRSGRMSEEASRTLVELGYTQVWDVPGGMNAWQASGFELITSDQ
jgi:rhodanese-related sulfurtransferase